MDEARGSIIECATCVAVDTTACSECIVTYLIANDAGPIEYVPSPVGVTPRDHTDRIVELFVHAGLVDDPVEFVPVEEFGVDVRFASAPSAGPPDDRRRP